MLPLEFTTRMKELLSSDFDAFIAQYDEKPIRAVRLNTLYCQTERADGILPFSVRSIPYDDNSYYVGDEFPEKPGRGEHHHAGVFYIQEPSAMSPLCALDIKDGIKILDICASPGGKTVQAAMKNPSGVIVTNEIIPSRARTLMGNIERMGIRNAIVTSTDSKTLADWFDSYFDLVICDAPCSGEGMFRKNPLAVSEWSTDNVKMCADRQSEILDNAAMTVARGGYLIYSTCTFSLAENEMQVDAFLKKHPDFTLCKVRDEVRGATSDGFFFEGCECAQISRCRRFYPHVSPGEGQFFALLKREGEGEGRVTYKDSSRALTKEEIKTVSDFLTKTLGRCELPLAFHGNDVIIPPSMPVPPYAVFSAGVRVGSIEKGRMVPHHQFFSAYGREFLRMIELDRASAPKYLNGETLSANIPDGWGVVTVNGVPLGGVKAVGGCLKNHYPKGLRNK